MMTAAMRIVIPKNSRVFVLDDTDERLRWFGERMPQMRSAKTSYEAIEILAAESFDVVFLDHDLSFLDAADPRRQHGNGKEVARFLAIRKFAGRVVIHSKNDDAVPAMSRILPHATIARYGDFEIELATGSAAR